MKRMKVLGILSSASPVAATELGYGVAKTEFHSAERLRSTAAVDEVEALMKPYFGPAEATRPKLELARLVYVSSDRASSCEKTFEDLKVLKREHCQQLVQDGKARYPEVMPPDVREAQAAGCGSGSC